MFRSDQCKFVCLVNIPKYLREPNLIADNADLNHVEKLHYNYTFNLISCQSFRNQNLKMDIKHVSSDSQCLSTSLCN